MSRRRRAALSLLCVVMAALVLKDGGLAHAHWGESGSGDGTVSTGTTVAVTLSPGAPTADLYPGGSADVLLLVSNPNLSAVHVASLTLDTSQGAGGFAVDPGHTGCAVGTLSFTTATNGGSGWTVPGKAGAVDGTLSVTLTHALEMGLAAANACQGATSTVYLTAGP